MCQLQLLDDLYLKRFCLSSNVDIAAYETGNITVNSCLCSDFNHSSVFYKGNNLFKNINILSIGSNSMGDIDGKFPSIHAEINALNKIKLINKRKKRLENINMLVIRLSKHNKLQNSKPCANCIKQMKTISEKRGYKIKNIYYSNNNEELVKSSLNKLENEELHYSKFYRKQSYINSQ
jgi:tRNA(Arg) A34 adenosine deaminase TadA